MSDQSQILFQAPEIEHLAPLFPAYHIESLIAIGGMGAVYKAVQKSLDRPVAIKILPQEFSRNPNFCTGFEAEAKSMARLNHPNLIGVYDFGEVNGMLFIIMELVSGQSLFHYAHGHRLAQDEVIQLMSGVCQGLAHAHENGIVHRDIKPSNVLLDANKEPKIGDFGLARPVGTDHAQGGQIYGTPGYTAPEVIHAPLSVNHRADIFSIGVLIHELLTGRLPADDPRPASVIVGCDPRFDEIIGRATNPTPELRYPNAQQILIDLLKIQQPIAVAPQGLQPPPSVYAARPAPRLVAAAPVAKKSSGFSSASGLAMFALAAALGFLVYKHYDRKPMAALAEPAPKPAPTPPPASKPEPDPPKPTPKPEPGQATAQKPTPHPASKPQPSPSPAPKPAPTTALKPAPKPSIVSIPTPVPKPEAEGHSQAPPKPATSDAPPSETVVEEPIQPALPTANSAAPASVPSFDTAGFLVTVQGHMKRNNERLTEEYHEALTKNLEDFGRGIKRAIRDESSRQSRQFIVRDLERFLERAHKNGGRIPESLGSKFGSLNDVELDHDKHLKKQTALDEKMLKEIEPIRESYISGLERKRAALTEKRDEIAAEEIAKEIELTRSDAGHFQQILGCEIPDVDERDDSDEWNELSE